MGHIPVVICHEALLVDPFNEDGFLEAATRGMHQKYPDNARAFLEQDSCATLLEILDVL